MLLYQLLAFSFHWERFKQPSVIIGLVVMRKAKGEDPNTDMLYTSLKFVSMGVVLIGMLVAIVTMQW